MIDFLQAIATAIPLFLMTIALVVGSIVALFAGGTILYGAALFFCMGFGYVFDFLVLTPIERSFTFIFRRRHASV